MTRISMLTTAMLTVASAALAQSNPNAGAVPNTGTGIVGPTYSAPGNQRGAAPAPGTGSTFSGPGSTTGASPSVGAGTPTFTLPAQPNSSTPPPPSSTQPNSTPVPPNSNAGHPPDETRGSGALPAR